jgi:hypothetical protein
LREGVEDEQGDARLLAEPTEQSFYLFDGDHVGVLYGMDAQGVHWGSPALADEIEPGDELVGPEPATIGCPAEWREG